MAITKEEITAALASPEAAEFKILSETLAEREFTFIPKKDLNTFYDTERARIASEKTSEIYSGLDKDILEATGIKKNADEKTYDYNKRAYAEFNNKISANQKKIDELEKRIAEGSQDKTLVTQVEALNAKNAELEKGLREKDSLLFQKDVNIEIKDALRSLPSFKKDLPEDVIKEFVDSTTKKLMESAKVENSKVVFYIGDKPILDDKAQVASAEYILKERLKSILDTGRQQQGAGSGNAGKGGSGGRLTSVPSGVTTQGQLMDEMMKMGYVKGTPEMNEDFNKLSVGLKLR